MFQKNFCKISSIDSSRYFAIIIPSVLSVFEEIKNLRNIFYNVVFFFSNCKMLLQHHIIKTKMKQSIWGVEKKIFDMCEHYSYITFSVVIKIFQKKLVKKSYFCFFCAIISSFFYRKFRQINIHHQRIYIVQQLFAESSPTRFG